MEEEWRVYLKENAPELYKQMLNSIKHQSNWRDRQIEQLQEENVRLLNGLKRLASPEAFHISKTTTKEDVMRMEYAEQIINSTPEIGKVAAAIEKVTVERCAEIAENHFDGRHMGRPIGGIIANAIRNEFGLDTEEELNE